MQFLDRLSVHGNARAACRAVGLSAEAAYKLRRRDPLFGRAWAAAVVLGRENCSQVLGDRAIEGIEEDIYFRGEVVGTRRRYDNRLLLAHLARLDQLANEPAASADAGRFDELLACIAEGAGTEPLPDRATHIEQASLAVEEYRRRELKPHEDAVRVSSGADGERAYAEQCRARAIVKLDRECAARATLARDAASEGWDRRRAEVVLTVDALCTIPEATASSTPGRTALPACAVTASAFAPLAKADAKFLPRTLSTPSNSALAMVLAATDARPNCADNVHTKTRRQWSAPQAFHRQPQRFK